MNLAHAAEGPPFDGIVIGGGINGCGIARELTASGLRVALLEADDFGFGTTWRSTRLIHGGLRYLEHGEFGLVRESLRERGRLLRERPHLVEAQPFVLPQLPWTRRPAWQVQIGLTTYDLLARGGGLPRHRKIGADELREQAAGIHKGASGGFAFYDAKAVAPERLAVELALEAEAAGATIANRARVTRIRVRRGAVEGVDVDCNGATISLDAPHVINAAGPWVDAVNQAAGVRGPRLIGATRGSHIAFEVPGWEGRAAVLSTARSDGRVFFALPHSGLLLVGTTDVRHDCDPSNVRPSEDELRYLLGEAQELLPGLGLHAFQVRYAYAGVRSLLASAEGNEAAITRRHAVIDHGAGGGPMGLYSVAGGKLSTYRPLAFDVMRHIGLAPAVARRSLASVSVDGNLAGIAPRAAAHVGRYGAHAPTVVRMGADQICPHSGAIAGEVEYAVRYEHATTVGDVLMRRTGVAWHSCRGLCCHREVARLMAAALGWDPEERDRHAMQYEREVEQHLPRWVDVVEEGSK